MDRRVDSELLKKLVKKLGKRATSKLAEKADLGQSTIEKLMAGTYVSYPKEFTRHRLCEALGAKEDQLFPAVRSRKGA